MSQIALPLAESKKPRRLVEPIVREAEIEGDYRWTMKRAWGAGPLIHWCLLNPSDADARRDDPTTLRMMTFSAAWGFGSLIVTNVYPFISSTTDKLNAWRKTFDWQAFQDFGMRSWWLDKSSWSAFHHNVGVVGRSAELADVSVAAWGASVDSADLEQILEGALMTSATEFGDLGFKIEWQCLGTNRDGSPRHPLARGRHRLSDDVVLRAWK